MLVGIEIFRDEPGQIAEFFGFRIDRVSEGADLVFVVVSRIQDKDFGVADNFIPVSRFYMRTRAFFDLDPFF